MTNEKTLRRDFVVVVADVVVLEAGIGEQGKNLVLLNILFEFGFFFFFFERVGGEELFCFGCKVENKRVKKETVM